MIGQSAISNLKSGGGWGCPDRTDYSLKESFRIAVNFDDEIMIQSCAS